MTIRRLSPNQPRGFELGSPYPFTSNCFLLNEIQLSKHNQTGENIEPNNADILRQAQRIQNAERVRNPKRKRIGPIEDLFQSSHKPQSLNRFAAPEKMRQGSIRRLSLKNSNPSRTPSPYGAPRKPPSARAREILDAAKKCAKPTFRDNNALSSLTRNINRPISPRSPLSIQLPVLAKQISKRTSRLPSPRKKRFLPASGAKKAIPKRPVSQGSNPSETFMADVEEVKEELCGFLKPTLKSLREDINDFEQCVEKLCADVEGNTLMVGIARKALLDMREEVRSLCLNIHTINDTDVLMKVREKVMQLKDDVAQIKKCGFDPGEPEFVYDKGILATKEAWKKIEDRLHLREALLHVDFTQYKEYYQFQKSKQFQKNVKAKVRRFLKDFATMKNEYKPGTEVRESEHLKCILGDKAKGQMGLYATKTFKAGDVIGAFRGKFYTLEESEFYHGEGMVGHKRSSYLMTVPFCKSDGRTNHFLCCDPFPKSGAVNDFRYDIDKTRDDPANDKRKQNMVWLLVTYNDIVYCMEIALKTIKAGEEILTHYSNDYSASEYFRQEKKRIRTEKNIKEVTRVPMVDICA